MKNKSTNPALLKRAIITSLEAIGIPESDIVFQNLRIELPKHGIVISAAIDEGRRVWIAQGVYSVLRLEDAFEKSVTTQLFKTAYEDDIILARKLALHLAVTRIDHALDSVLVESAGGLQR